MVRERVGSIMSLWRYPVKSMLGQALETSEITAQGLWGDRAYALQDIETGRIASAKNPRKWAKLLDFQASLPPTAEASEPMPAVAVMLPDGNSITSGSADMDEVLSTLVGRTVKLLSAVPATPSLDQYWPPVEGTAFQDEVTELLMPPGTFFDSCPIHAITTATLARLQELYPAGAFRRERFRPNMVIEPLAVGVGFVEEAWVGGVLAIGEAVRLSVDTACPRCVVTTLAQAGLPEDIEILRTTANHNQVIAGIRLSVLQGGTIHRGDPIWLEAAD